MAKLIIRSMIYGFILGVVLFGVAPLGLGISFIEHLKPILVPGVLLTQVIFGYTIGTTFILFALFLNGVIYSIIFYVFYTIRVYMMDKQDAK